MAYDPTLADRIRRHFAGRTDVVERRMFGGLAFMVGGHLCCGVLGPNLVARVGPADYPQMLGRPHVRPMDFTGRPLTGLVYVGPGGTRSTAALRAWIVRGEKVAAGLSTHSALRRRVRRRPNPRAAIRKKLR